MNDQLDTSDDKSFLFHCDPGHAWLEVSKDELANIGLSTKDFSEYSYKQGSDLYLEEDCDAPIFINKFKECTGRFPRIIELDDQKSSPVRSMAGLRP